MPSAEKTGTVRHQPAHGAYIFACPQLSKIVVPLSLSHLPSPKLWLVLVSEGAPSSDGTINQVRLILQCKAAAPPAKK